MSEPECTWPHAWMTAEEEAALEAVIAVHQPFIDAMARKLGKVDELLTADLAQGAVILLWTWGTERVRATDVRVVRGAIVREMMATLRAEWHAGGWGRGRYAADVAPRSSSESDDP